MKNNFNLLSRNRSQVILILGMTILFLITGRVTANAGKRFIAVSTEDIVKHQVQKNAREIEIEIKKKKIVLPSYLQGGEILKILNNLKQGIGIKVTVQESDMFTPMLSYSIDGELIILGPAFLELDGPDARAMLLKQAIHFTPSHIKRFKAFIANLKSVPKDVRSMGNNHINKVKSIVSLLAKNEIEAFSVYFAYLKSDAEFYRSKFNDYIHDRIIRFKSPALERVYEITSSFISGDGRLNRKKVLLDNVWSNGAYPPRFKIQQRLLLAAMAEGIIPNDLKYFLTPVGQLAKDPQLSKWVLKWISDPQYSDNNP